MFTPGGGEEEAITKVSTEMGPLTWLTRQITNRSGSSNKRGNAENKQRENSPPPFKQTNKQTNPHTNRRGEEGAEGREGEK